MLALTPIAAALHFLQLAENLFQNHLPAFPVSAAVATRAYLLTIERE